MPTAPGCEEILHPGKLEARNEARHLKEGLDQPEKSWTDLKEQAGRFGVDWPNAWAPAIPPALDDPKEQS